MADLHAMIAERCAAKIEAGKRPSKADLEWLEATAERAPSESSVELTRNAKGEMQFSAKVYNGDALEAERIAKDIANRLRATYPMKDGTVGSEMVSDPERAARTAAAIARSQAKGAK